MSIKFNKNSIQDAYINSCRHENSEIIVSLSNNSSERGYVVAFDEGSLVIRNDNDSQILIMKSSIITIKTISGLNFIFNTKIKDRNNSGSSGCAPIEIHLHSNCKISKDKENDKINRDMIYLKEELRKDAYKSYINNLPFMIDPEK
mgnify:CR=1 FL=1